MWGAVVAAIARLRAAETPRLAVARKRIRGSARNGATAPATSSGAPSSMTTHSHSASVCAWSEASASPTRCATLYAGTITAARGGERSRDIAGAFTIRRVKIGLRAGRPNARIRSAAVHPKWGTAHLAAETGKRRNPGPTPPFEIKLQKGVDPTPAHPYMALHRRGADAMPARHRSPIQAGQSSPYHKSGSDGCPPLLLDGSL